MLVFTEKVSMFEALYLNFVDLTSIGTKSLTAVQNLIYFNLSKDFSECFFNFSYFLYFYATKFCARFHITFRN